MNLRLALIDKHDIEVFRLLKIWDHDPKIQPFVMPRRSEKPIEEFPADLHMAGAIKNKTKTMYMVLDDHVPIGYMSIDTDFFMLKSTLDHVGWISIIIGNRDYWGKHIGTWMLEALEEEGRKLGCQYFELGVFSFNEKAIKLYKRMAYNHFETIKSFVYYDGEWFDDYRMIKKL